ncbi:DUF916 and DUF3324 domain-containing protein [Lactococcus lactis]|uniref:DUF916 and DUF3324 domain-containing protein n=1 Tax=Lactococcus lactis TaxID=1358 RepID=UPI001D182C9E|nr:DUF916 and DUF3324 domain-containing protein [Lactococcus lactis]MCC4121979.1 DUF916 and DUF3324 domain-containing protein [Lactococcus lactis]
MKFKINKIAICFIFSLILITGFSTINYADDSSASDMGGFSIEGIPNENQLDKDSGYFYLKERPSQRDKIKIKLINTSNEEKNLEVKIVNANTNSNGIIDYSGSLEDNKILHTPLTTILKPESIINKVPANSSVETTVDINMPAVSYKGVVMGGIVVSEKEKNVKKDTGAIGNKYSYTLGVVLTNEDKVQLFSNVSVELQNVISRLSFGRKVIQANIINPNPYIFSKAEVKGAVYNEDGKTKIKENSLNNVSIAPYSALPFQIDWQKDDLKPGTYIFKGSVKTEENTWNFEKKFEIKTTEAKKINEESVFKVVLPIWFIYSGYLVILINIIGSFYIFIRKLKKQGEA